MNDAPAESADSFVRYFERLSALSPHHKDPQCVAGVTFARRWADLIAGRVPADEESAVIALMRSDFLALPGYGSARDDMLLRFNGWLRETGRTPWEPAP